MATRALRLIDRIVAVGLFERCLVTIMTPQAERSLTFHQKILLIRTVSKMAGGASFIPNFVGHFLFIILFLMTLITSLVAFCLHQVARLRGMGIMAESAIPFVQNSMDMRFIQPYLFFAMAGIADLIPLFLQEEFWNHPMPEVTVLAFLLFDNGVDTLHSEVLIRKFLVAVEAILPRKPPFATRGLCSSSKGPGCGRRLRSGI